MDKFLNILLFKMDTVDGRPDTIYIYQNQLLQNKYKNLKPNIITFKNREIAHEQRLKIVQKLMYKFKLMRIRSKISYAAFIN